MQPKGYRCEAQRVGRRYGAPHRLPEQRPAVRGDRHAVWKRHVVGDPPLCGPVSAAPTYASALAGSVGRLSGARSRRFVASAVGARLAALPPAIITRV